ncbi:aminopeptidase Iap family-like protein [Thermogladius calderae 1633]|uniref:Aminopeptidase Iap family-like protein n=1 Tax=Thermogladius calderae (strain DSM 22663 / VKM B-2946 / 1633) TaxID=1184251 RepID=I3TE18_THEC1|nr:M28 family peptidase [Thermogladius calderae]AFK51006.1 aminopeptidase Iap family-like protein [Thermogladius calderae 1633]
MGLRVFRGPFAEEVVTGSTTEQVVVRGLEELFVEVADWVKVFDTPVVSWVEESCRVVAGDTVVECRVMPPVTDFEVEGRLVVSQTPMDMPDRAPEGSILLAGYTGSALGLSQMVQEAVSRGFSGVITYDPTRDSFKREVVSGSARISLEAGSPPAVPVVSIKAEDARRLAKLSGTRIGLSGKAKLVRGAVGKTVVAGLNGRGELEVHVTAHHDHWLSGYYDDLAGLETLLQVARLLRQISRAVNVVLVSFTAKEFGSPGLTTWYWSWGSRYFLEALASRGKDEGVIASITVDNLSGESVRVSSHPLLDGCAEKAALGVQAYFDGSRYLPYLDSYSYLLHSIPSVAVHDQPRHLSRGHVEEAVEEQRLRRLVERLAELTANIAVCLSTQETDLGQRRPEDLFPYGDSELRYLAGKIAMILDSAGSLKEKAKVLKEFHATVAYYEPWLEVSYGLLEDVVAVKRVMEEVEKGVGGRFAVEALDNGLLIELLVNDFNRSVAALALAEVYRRRVRRYLEKSNNIVARMKGVV